MLALRPDYRTHKLASHPQTHRTFQIDQPPALLNQTHRTLGGAGRGGGMPDLASLMNNPQVMQMAQQLASNGGLANMMQNPAVANMVPMFLYTLTQRNADAVYVAIDESCP